MSEVVREIEGTWEEVRRQEADLAGKRVRIQVFRESTADAATELRRLLQDTQRQANRVGEAETHERPVCYNGTTGTRRMTLTIDLTPSEEARLNQAARERGMLPTELARQLIAQLPADDSAPRGSDELRAMAREARREYAAGLTEEFPA